MALSRSAKFTVIASLIIAFCGVVFAFILLLTSPQSKPVSQPRMDEGQVQSAPTLPPEWTLTPAPPSPPAALIAPTGTKRPTERPSSEPGDQGYEYAQAISSSQATELFDHYPQLDRLDLYSYPERYSQVQFRISGRVIDVGFHETNVESGPTGSRAFVVQLDPGIEPPPGTILYLAPHLVLGIDPSAGVVINKEITIFGYGLGEAYGENAAGGTSVSSGIFAEYLLIE